MGLLFVFVNCLVYTSGAFLFYKCFCYKDEDYEQPILSEYLNNNYETIYDDTSSDTSSDTIEELPKYDDIDKYDS